MASKTQTATIPEELQDVAVKIVEKAIAGARQASGTVSRMKDMNISFKRDETDPIALGVLGSRKRHDEILGLVRDIIVPCLDAPHRVAIAKAISERFERKRPQG